ncbi:MAG TPA: toll/interleukin-1 receptor domain-containing protein [Pirellulales bacterium]|jgi:hypothetical protein
MMAALSSHLSGENALAVAATTTDGGYDPKTDELSKLAFIVILAIDEMAWDDPILLNHARGAATRLAGERVFHFFACTPGLSPDAIHARARSGNRLASLLVDSMHLRNDATPDATALDVARAIHSRNDAIDVAHYRTLVRHVGHHVRSGITVVQFLSVPLVLATAVLYRVSSVGWRDTHLPAGASAIIAAVASAAAVHFAMLPVFLWLGGDQASRWKRQSTDFAPRSTAHLVACVLFITTAHATGQPHWTWFGLALGLLMEVSRRRATRLTRPGSVAAAFQNLERDRKGAINRAHRLLDELPSLDAIPLCAALPRHTVFVSYSRASRWSSESAQKFAANFARTDIRVFLDQLSIQPGDSWRQTLNREIETADIFVLFLDDFGMSREWVASEIMAALDGRSAIGRPAIFVAIDPMTRLPVDGVAELFAPLIDPQRVPRFGRPTVMRIDSDADINMLALTVRRVHPIQLLPGSASALIFMLSIPVLAVAVTAACVLGIPAMILGPMMANGKLSWAAAAAANGLDAPIIIALAFIEGVAIHLCVASRFKMAIKDRKTLAVVQSIPAIGIFWTICAIAKYCHPIALAWSGVLIGFGWLAGASFISGVGLGKPSTVLESAAE